MFDVSIYRGVSLPVARRPDGIGRPGAGRRWTECLGMRRCWWSQKVEEWLLLFVGFVNGLVSLTRVVFDFRDCERHLAKVRESI